VTSLAAQTRRAQRTSCANLTGHSSVQSVRDLAGAQPRGADPEEAAGPSHLRCDAEAGDLPGPIRSPALSVKDTLVTVGSR